MMLRSLLLCTLSVMVVGCGFHLRGVGERQFGLHTLGLTARDAYGATLQLTRKGLEANAVQVTTSAPYTLVLVRETEASRAASYTRGMQSAEVELLRTLGYQIVGRNNQPLLSNSIEVRRIYVTDENNITGADASRSILTDEMTRELVQKLLSRIQMLSPAQLDALQAAADATATAKSAAQAQAASSELGAN